MQGATIWRTTGYSFEVPARETAQAKHIIMHNTVSCNLRSGVGAREFAWSFFPILIFLIDGIRSQLRKIRINSLDITGRVSI